MKLAITLFPLTPDTPNRRKRSSTEGTNLPVLKHPKEPKSKDCKETASLIPLDHKEQKSEKTLIKGFVDIYYDLMTNHETTSFKNFFGLRDFVHFLSYLNRQKIKISPAIVVNALERNFNGRPYFKDLVIRFLTVVSDF